MAEREGMLRLAGEAEPVGTWEYDAGVFSTVAWLPEGPAVALSNVGPTGSMGAVQPTGHPDLDDWLIAQSPLRDAPRDYFPTDLDVAPLLARRDDDFACVIAHGRLSLDLAADEVAHGESLAAFLVARARVTAALDTHYPPITPIHAEDAEAEELAVVRALAEEEASWVGLSLARQGSGLTGQPTLAGHGPPLVGELRIECPPGGALQLSLRGGLPGVGTRVSLRPEDRGLLGALARRGERVIGDADLDPAWVIRCPPDGAALVRALRAPLLALRPHEARVDLFPDLVTVEVRAEFTHERLRPILREALLCWDLAARFQIAGQAGPQAR